MIKVFLVDDHKILADAIADYMKNFEDINCLGIALSACEALEKIPKLGIDVVLLDIGLPDMTGIECCTELLKQDPELRILGLSTHQDVSIVKKFFKAGARGYLSKATNLDELYDAVKLVYSGEKYMGKTIRNALLNEIQDDHKKAPSSYLIPKLTSREQEVLLLIAKEFTTEEMAKQLYISKNTVESHRRKLISKFGVRNSVGLIRKAIALKLINI